MVTMIANQKVKYPRGPHGREHEKHAVFEVATDKEAFGLKMRGLARYAEPVNKTDLPVEVMKPKVEEAPVEPEAPLRYLRRDMRATDGPTGEETSAPSSRRGRQPRKQTSDD